MSSLFKFGVGQIVSIKRIEAADWCEVVLFKDVDGGAVVVVVNQKCDHVFGGIVDIHNGSGVEI